MHSIYVFLILLVLSTISSTYAQPNNAAKTNSIESMILKADSLARIQDYNTAIEVGIKAIAKAESEYGTEDSLLAQCSYRLGVYYYYIADYSNADIQWKKALKIRENIFQSEHPDIAASLNGLAVLYRNQGKYTEAEPLYKRALAIREKAFGSESSQVAASLNNLANLFRNQARYSEAEPLYKRALEINEKILGSEHTDLAATLNSLANLYKIQGKYTEAEILYKRALTIWEKAHGPEHTNVVAGLGNLATLYRLQGRIEEAQPLQERALSIATNTLGSEHPDVASNLNDLALLFWRQGKYDEAETLFKRSLAIWEKVFGEEKDFIAKCISNLGIIYHEQGRYAEAEAQHIRALEINKKVLGPNHPNVAYSLNNLSCLYKSMGMLRKSIDGFERGLEIMHNVLSAYHPDITANLGDLATLYVSLGENKKSIEYYKKLQKSRREFIEYAFSYSSEDQKMRYIKEFPVLENSLLSYALIEKSDASLELALEMTLAGKGIVIDAVSLEKEIAYYSYDDNTKAKIDQHTKTCGEIANLTLSVTRSVNQKFYSKRLEDLYKIKDSLEVELSRSCMEFDKELTDRRFKVADIINAIPKDAVLWEMVRYQPYDFNKTGIEMSRFSKARYLGFTVDHSGNISISDLGDASEIDSLVVLIRRTIYNAGYDIYKREAKILDEQLSKLTRVLFERTIEPLIPSLRNKAQIFISPDGQLNLIPFEILPESKGKYMIETYKICYLSSGRDLLKFNKQQERSDYVLAMANPEFESTTGRSGNRNLKKNINLQDIQFTYKPSRGVSSCLKRKFEPLPYTETEVQEIAKTLKKKGNLRVDTFYRDEALESVIKGMKSPPYILHLSTHGYFCEDLKNTIENPLLRSGIALAGANRKSNEMINSKLITEDGILTALEVSGLNLSGTDLVVLSACETGIGEVKNGEGVFGMRRAFQYAGANTIVMSLWKVPDKETYELMQEFYANWMHGESKIGALRKSILRIMDRTRKKYGSAHPYFWGGFILSGDPN